MSKENFRKIYKNKWFWGFVALKTVAKVAVVVAMFVGCGNAYARNIEESLQRLDREIENSKTTRDTKEKYLSMLRERLRSSRTPDEKFNLNRELYKEYVKYQYDSAYSHARAMLEIAKTTPENKTRLNTARIAMMESFSTAGLFKEVDDMLDSISEPEIALDELPNYYNQCAMYYGTLSSYAGFNSEVSALYRRQRVNYLNKLLSVTPRGGFMNDYALLGKKEMEGMEPLDRAQAFETMLERKDLTDGQRAMLHSVAGRYFREGGKEEDGLYHLAESAIYDLKSNTRETTATKDLAQMLYSRGDLDRASRYIHLALEDAQNYNSRLRQIEINAILPEIENSRYGKVSMRLWVLTGITVTILLLLLLTVWLALKLRSKSRSLHESHRELRLKKEELEESNERLKRLNSQLKETAEIRDRYIIQSLIGNTDFVNSVEEKIQKALVKLKLKHNEEAIRILQKAGTKDERERMYASFDTAFLQLFPNFPAEFNALFPKENRMEISSEQGMPMEVRIYALMRLGIDKAEEVAKYLNLSVNTVYVYKTRLKSRSSIGKDGFEEAVKAIPKL